MVGHLPIGQREHPVRVAILGPMADAQAGGPAREHRPRKPTDGHGRLLIKRRFHLIEQQHGRSCGEGPQQRHPSKLAARELSWVFDARRASTSTLATHSIDCVAASSFPSPMAMTSLAVSKASTKERCVFKGRTFPKTTNQCGLLYPTARAPQDSEPKIANCPRSLYSWHFPKRDLESLAQTHRSWREREPKECATMRRAPSPSAVMAISR